MITKYLDFDGNFCFERKIREFALTALTTDYRHFTNFSGEITTFQDLTRILYSKGKNWETEMTDVISRIFLFSYPLVFGCSRLQKDLPWMLRAAQRLKFLSRKCWWSWWHRMLKSVRCCRNHQIRWNHHRMLVWRRTFLETFKIKNSVFQNTFFALLCLIVLAQE